MTITITLPWPDSALSPNAGKRSMWPVVRARKAYPELAWGLWLEAASCDGDGQGQGHRYHRTSLTPPVVATITFTYTKKRDRDIDIAASLQPIWDGAKDAGVIVDDLDSYEVAFVRGPERGVSVTLKVKP